MQNQPSTTAKIYLAILVILGWFTLITQFYINVGINAASLSEIITRYFSYFTILTNLLVTVCCTVLLFVPNSKWGNFFSKQQTLTAIVVYIVIVGLIYNIILRSTWQPKGMQLVIDELLHSVIPLLFLIYWLVFVGKNQLKWRNILPWLIYPFAYIVFVLIRGSASGFYPYPFINTMHLGLNKVLVNSVGIALVFIIVSLAFVAYGKAMNKEI